MKEKIGQYNVNGIITNVEYLKWAHFWSAIQKAMIFPKVSPLNILVPMYVPLC